MTPMNAGYREALGTGRLTVGLMTPAARSRDALADVELELRMAQLADRLGFAALWTRDVPLAIGQGSDGEAVLLDDPFAWLATLAASTRRIALGTAAIVLPLRHPLHVIKSALSLDHLSGGRFILGLGSGDRPAEFAAFGHDEAARGERFRRQWPLIRAALSADPAERRTLLDATGGYEILRPPTAGIPMLVVGSARQTLQWIAAHADGWATYHREEARQEGRIGLWHEAVEQRGGDRPKVFVQSLSLELAEDPHARPEPIELGLRVGARGLVDYLRRLESAGVGHTILVLPRTSRPPIEVVEEIGREVLPWLA